MSVNTQYWNDEFIYSKEIWFVILNLYAKQSDNNFFGVSLEVNLFLYVTVIKNIYWKVDTSKKLV